MERASTAAAVDGIKAGLRPELLRAAVAELESELAALRARRDAITLEVADTAKAEARVAAVQRLSEQAARRLPGTPLASQREVLALLGVRVSVLDSSARPGLDISGEFGFPHLPPGEDLRIPFRLAA